MDTMWIFDWPGLVLWLVIAAVWAVMTEHLIGRINWGGQVVVLQRQVSDLEIVELAFESRFNMPGYGKGFVYVIKDIDVSGHCKIGRTTQLERRMRNFDIKLPFRTEVLHIIRTDDCIALEKHLHRQYASKRVRGEWFALDDDDIAAIRRLA